MWRVSLSLAALLAISAPACGDKGPPPGTEPANVFAERTDAEMREAIKAAREQAKREGKHVLLEFVAPWCTDCREVTRVTRLEPAASVLREKYVVVPVNVGRFDRHKALIAEHEVKIIAALVVLDADGNRVAKTTLEPITKKEALTPDELAAWLRAPGGS